MYIVCLSYLRQNLWICFIGTFNLDALQDVHCHFTVILFIQESKAALSGFLINLHVTIVTFLTSITKYIRTISAYRSQWSRGLRRRSLAARLLTLCVRIPPVEWMFVCCDCCVLSRRGLCDGLITRQEESYRMWRLVVCDQKPRKRGG